MASTVRSRVCLYLPREVWERVKELARRDDVSASRLVTEELRRVLQARLPGNPQRPLTAFDPSHPDSQKDQARAVMQALLAGRDPDGLDVTWRKILALAVQLAPEPRMARNVADAAAGRLTLLGARVWR